jgi:hypothetical protein
MNEAVELQPSQPAVVPVQRYPSDSVNARVLDHVRVDLDQIKTLTDELAARFGVQPPHIEPKNLPKWWPDGVRPLLRQGQPVIKVETRPQRPPHSS